MESVTGTIIEYQPKPLSDEERKEILEELRKAVGPEWVKDDPAFCAPCSRDAFQRVDEPDYLAQFVVLPSADSAEEEISEVMKIARKHGLVVGVSGSGGNVMGVIAMHRGGIIVESRRMDKFEIDEESMTATVEAGVTYSNLRAEATKRRLKTDVPGAPTTTSIVANICLIGGEHFNDTKYGYGQTKVLGMEMVLPTGEIVRTGSLAFPDLEPGYFGPDMDFSTIPVSVCGTAGIVTKLVMKLFPLGDVKKHSKYVSLGLFTDLTPALSAMRELTVEELGVGVGEAGPRYFAGVFPTPSLEDHYKMMRLIAKAGLKTVVWCDTRGTKEQVKYQKRRALEIFAKHGGIGELTPLAETIFLKPAHPELVARLLPLLGIKIEKEWVPRLAEMFDISETPCRGFGVKSHSLVGAVSAGVKVGKEAGDAFHAIMKRMDYPEYKDAEWSSYGTLVRGGASKCSELDVGFDRKDVESCDWRDKYFDEFITGAMFPPYIWVVVSHYLVSRMKVLLKREPLEISFGPTGMDIWLKLKDIVDPDRTMHRPRHLDAFEVKA